MFMANRGTSNQARSQGGPGGQGQTGLLKFDSVPPLKT